ncbi:hypothetical protein EG626_23760 [Salmonella enterica]|nr:hypothetical protein [Salmonella enterica]
MEVNKISQIIALCDSIPVMLDTKILDAESAIKTLALIRQLAEEAQAQAERHEYNAYEAGYRAAHPKGQCSPEHAAATRKTVYVNEVDPNEPEKDGMVYFDRDGNLTKETQKRLKRQTVKAGAK